MSTDNSFVYLDNGATSFPKPPAVAAAMERFTREVGGSPGRSGHRLSQKAARIVFSCRETLASLFGATDSKRIIFTLNASQSLNMALLGLLEKGDRVVTTSMEHNSVMRPLRHLEETGVIALEVVPADRAGRIDLDRVESALREAPRLLVSTHASNVTGTVMPIAGMGALCRRRKTLFLVDAAQTAGVLPIDVEEARIDVLAFTGHKGLLGPQGTGGLWLRETVDIEPLFRGGTGSNSELEEQPVFYPDRLESGTLNAVGIAGLLAGISFILENGIERILERERTLTARLLEGLAGIDGVTIHGPAAAADRTAVVSLTIEGMAPSETGFIIEEAWGILSRVGLHCAPAAHRTIGTFPRGTVRLCPGYFTTEEEIDRALDALSQTARRRRGA